MKLLYFFIITTSLHSWSLQECKIAAYGFNEAVNSIIIGKVQKGIRPTKYEACHIPNIAKAYIDRCAKYESKSNMEQVKKIYPSYVYACEQWVG